MFIGRTILIAFVLFLIIDIPYLLFIGGSHYKDLIQQIQGSPLQLRYFGALITYILMALAVKYLVLDKSRNVKDILFYASLTGLITYGIYDFTNYATFDDWSLVLSIQDIVWGMALFTMVSYITSIVEKK